MYFNVPSTSAISVTARNPPIVENPVTLGISDPTGSPAAIYYNIPKLMPRNSHTGNQSRRSTANSQGPSLPQQKVLNNPPVPRRQKPPAAVRSCPSTNVTRPSKDSTCHSYYVFSVPIATTDVNCLQTEGDSTGPRTGHSTGPRTGYSTGPRIISRSESLNNVGSCSPYRKDKPASCNNNHQHHSSNVRTSGGRLWRRYSVGDILSKLQAAVSGGLSLPRGLVRSVSRFSMTPSANPASSPNKASPDPSRADDAFFPSGLKQRSSSEILHRSPQTEDIAPRKSPSPDREVPPVPPPRLVVRTKAAAKTKVLEIHLLFCSDVWMLS